VSFPFEVETVSGTEALERRDALLTAGRGYPVIAGAPENLETLADGDASDGSGVDCVQAAGGIDVDDWLAQRVAGDREYYEEEHGDWPSDAAPNSTFTGPTDILTGEPLAEVAIFLVPGAESWQVPCVLGYGEWNEYPPPAEHSAILKRWQDRHGATLVTMTQDTVELAVERPVRTRDDALALAQEQYIYCADIVQQGTETIERLAASLVDAPVWFFWWD
jgi:Domain of unknown function (DUF4253)